MGVHVSVMEMAKRLRWFLPLAGGMAAVVFSLTLSHTVFPGASAALCASVIGVTPPTGISHPLFSWVARAVASVDVLTLPVRMNLLSALCGMCCVMLFYHLVAKLILFSACEDEGGGGQSQLMDEDDADLDLLPEVLIYNRRVFKIAVVGGFVAAFLLTVLAPTWCAATRFGDGMFDLMVALVSACLFPVVWSAGGSVRLALSCFFFTLGLFESALFLLLLPVFAVVTFKSFLSSMSRLAFMCCLLIAGGMGAALSFVVFRENLPSDAIFSVLSTMRFYALSLPVHHFHELRSFFPRLGGLLIVLQVGVPALVLLFGKQLLFKERQANTLLALLLVTAAVSPAMLNLPVAPFGFFDSLFHLPVFAYATLAAAAAVAFSACLICLGPDDKPHEADAVELEDMDSAGSVFHRGFVGTLFAVLLLMMLVTPWRSFRAVDSRSVRFTDEISRKILDSMQGRTWLISSGFLDDHLRIQAYMSHQTVNLVSLHARPSQGEQDGVRRLIESEGVFEGLNRQRLVNALSIGAVHFVMEWFRMDPNAGAHAMVFATPDIWTECGFRAIPEGLAFGGARPEAKADLAAIERINRSFADQVLPLVDRGDDVSPQLASLRGVLRMKVSFALNELGVMLEDGGEYERAYQVYQRAIELEPSNVSAAINSYALALAQHIHDEALDRLKNRMTTAMANRDMPVRGLMGVLQNYGTIRTPEYYQQQAAMWSAIGSRTIASDKLRQAWALTKKNGASALVQNAMIYSLSGDLDKAEACYRSALEEDGKSVQALSGLCTLLLTRHKAADAEQVIGKAIEAGVDRDVLLYQTITLAILKRNIDEALRLLKKATEKYPDDLRYWMLQADVMLQQGNINLVEHTVVPEIKKRLRNDDHFIVHVIQGLVLRQKGPRCFREARLSLIKALSMNAALPDVWDAVFNLDVAIGNLEFTEVDARSMLAIDSNHAFANYLMGVCLLAKGRLKEAEDFQRRSIENSPTAVAYNDLAENLRLQNRLADAEDAARKALALDAALEAAHDTLASVLCDAGRFQEAEEMAAKAVAHKPDLMLYQLTLLRAEIGLGKRDEVSKRSELLKRANFAIPADVQKSINTM